MGKRQLKHLALLLFLSLFLLPTRSFAERNWKAGDSDLPQQLQGMSQDQLDIINRTNELNPSSSSFNPSLLAMFKSMQANPPAVRTGDSTTLTPNPTQGVTSAEGGAPTGVGAPPSPSDGPTTTTGGGLFGVDPMAKEVHASSEGEFAIFFGQFFAPDTMDQLMKEEEDVYGAQSALLRMFFGPASGNALNFGDTTGVQPIEQPGGTPGNPPGGPATSRDAESDTRQASMGMRYFPSLIGDMTIVADIHNGDLDQAKTLIQGVTGVTPGVDYQAQGQ